MKAPTNYIGLQTLAQMETAVRLTSEFLEMPPAEVCEFHVMLALDILTHRRDVEAAQELINGNDPDES
jgi:hypothetical protein